MKTIGKWLIPAAGLLLPLGAVLALDVPGPVVTGNDITLNEVENLINGLARFLIVISVVVAVIFIIYGGLRWIMARDNEEAAGKAKTMIMNGIWGALIILGIGVILTTLSGVVSRAFFGTFSS